MLKNAHFRLKTTEQGASSTVVAATNLDLDGKGGAYIANCNEVQVASYANDMDAAKKLWDLTEKMINQ